MTLTPHAPPDHAAVLARRGPDDGWSPARAGVVAGIGILAMIPLAVLGNFGAVTALVTPGDPARTAADVLGSPVLFRAGIASFFVVIALDLVVAWALYRALAPVSRSLSMLAALLRVVYSGVYLVAVAQLSGVLGLLGDAHLTAFSTEQRGALALLRLEAFDDVWGAGLFLFGLHLALTGYLVHRSGYLPRLIGVLLVLAGAGYVVDSLASALTAGPWTDVSTVTFVGELLLALWLVTRGRHTAVTGPATGDDLGAGAR